MKKEHHDSCKKDEKEAVTHFVISQFAETNDDCTTDDDNAIEIVNVTKDFGTLDDNVTTPSQGLVDRLLGGINRLFILDKHEQRGGTKKK